MHLSAHLAAFLAGINSCAASAVLPLTASGRWIQDTKGQRVTYAGVNWPGHQEVMIPEGLQYQSVATIVGKIKSLGMNVIRLTYATEMIDNLYDSKSDTSVKTSLSKALGPAEGTRIWNMVSKYNPWITESTTRLQTFDAVAAECLKQGILVHLDNHMSKATWCCGSGDGNSWFGDTYFDAAKWQRGWTFMANHVC